MKVLAAYVVLLLSLAVVFSPEARAQTKDEKLEKAKVHFDRAIKFFKEGNYKDALIDFEASYNYRPHWKLKFNMAWCLFQLYQDVKAATLLKEFFKEGGDSIKQEDREQALKLFADLKDKLATLTLTGEIGDAAIEIDGRILEGAEEGEEIFLDPGKHKILVTSAGETLVDEEIKFKAGQNKEIRVKLLVVGKGEEEASVKEETTAEEPVETPSEAKPGGGPGGKNRLAAGGWAALALGSAMLAAAAVTGGLAGREKALMQDAEDAYRLALPDTSVSDEELDGIRADRDNHYDRGMTMLYAMAGLMAAGGVTLAASVALLVLSKKKKTEKPVVAGAQLTFGPGSFGLRLSF